MEVVESYLNENFGGVQAKHSSDEVMQNWRMVCVVVKNPKRRFRFTAKLSKRNEAAAMRQTNQNEVTRNNKVIRLPSKRSQIKVQITSGELKKEKSATKAKDEVECEKKKARLPPKRGRVIIRVIMCLHKSAAKLASELGKINLQIRKNKVVPEEK